MKTACRCFSVAALALGAVLLTPQLVQAQGSPSGSVTNTISNPSNLVWDVETVLKEIDFTITNNSSSVEISYPVGVQQSGQGRLSGAAGTTVTVNDGGSVSTFPGDYKITGSITSNRGRGRASLNAIVKGTGDIGGATRKVTAKNASSLSFDNVAGTVSGTDRNSASAAGLGSISSSDSFSKSLTSVFPGDGSWTLVLKDLSTDAKNKITGTAVVTLNSGEEFQYAVLGVFKAKDGTSKLVLKAMDDVTKGSSLQVGLNGNSVTAIKGKIAGQMVNVSLP